MVNCLFYLIYAANTPPISSTNPASFIEESIDAVRAGSVSAGSVFKRMMLVVLFLDKVGNIPDHVLSYVNNDTQAKVARIVETDPLLFNLTSPVKVPWHYHRYRSI